MSVQITPTVGVALRDIAVSLTIVNIREGFEEDGKNGERDMHNRSLLFSEHSTTHTRAVEGREE